jgi:2-hydroxy-3-keto-5-methylthiopentenyl-1-phosphate phosphatase
MGRGESYIEMSHVCLVSPFIDIDFGHDKSRAIKPYAALPADGRPILVYCGDGVSDISAAKETDLLFAKKGRDLVVHCLNENVPFYPFDVLPSDILLMLDVCRDQCCCGRFGEWKENNCASC